MKSLFKRSFQQFKQDALSQIFYDILRWLIPTLILFALSTFIPSGTSVSEFLVSELRLSMYAFVLLILSIITITILLINVIFRKKYLALQQDNFTDELTGMKNYKALKSYLPNKITEANENAKNISLILIDVDNFKNFNDTVGYRTSDKILAKVGQLLNNDKRATDETFRQFLRGDEFLVVANDTSATDAFRAAERKRKLIEATTFMVDNKTYNLTVSCGVTEMQRGEDYETFTERVNAALIDAKASAGKNATRSRT